MPHQRHSDRDAGVYHPGPPEGRPDPFDVRVFARHFILLAIAGARVRVFRKADGVVGTLAYYYRPLRFDDFRPDTGGPRP